jgi:hypothetical protein
MIRGETNDMNKNENNIVALYPGKAEAEAAVERIRNWDKQSKEVKLGAIGYVTNEAGVIKSELIGGIFGSAFGLSFPISKEAIAALGNELRDGKVAVVVAGDDYEVSMVKRHLEQAGGRVIAAEYERTAEELEDERKAAERAVQEAIHQKVVDHSIDVNAINKTGFN